MPSQPPPTGAGTPSGGAGSGYGPSPSTGAPVSLGCEDDREKWKTSWEIYDSNRSLCPRFITCLSYFAILVKSGILYGLNYIIFTSESLIQVVIGWQEILM